MDWVLLTILLSSTLFVHTAIGQNCDVEENYGDAFTVNELAPSRVVVKEYRVSDGVARVESESPYFGVGLEDHKLQISPTDKLVNYLDTSGKSNDALFVVNLICGGVTKPIDLRATVQDENNRKPEFTPTEFESTLTLPAYGVPVNWQQAIRVSDLDFLEANTNINFEFDPPNILKFTDGYPKKITYPSSTRLDYYEIFFELNPTVTEPGNYNVNLKATNDDGTQSGEFEIKLELQKKEVDTEPPKVEPSPPPPLDELWENIAGSSKTVARVSDDFDDVEDLILEIDGDLKNYFEISSSSTKPRDDGADLVLVLNQEIPPEVLHENNYLIRLTIIVKDVSGKPTVNYLNLEFKKVAFKFKEPYLKFPLIEGGRQELQNNLENLFENDIFKSKVTFEKPQPIDGVDSYLSVEGSVGGEWSLISSRTEEDLIDNDGNVDIFILVAKLGSDEIRVPIIIHNQPTGPTTQSSSSTTELTSTTTTQLDCTTAFAETSTPFDCSSCPITSTTEQCICETSTPGDFSQSTDCPTYSTVEDSSSSTSCPTCDDCSSTFSSISSSSPIFPCFTETPITCTPCPSTDTSPPDSSSSTEYSDTQSTRFSPSTQSSESEATGSTACPPPTAEMCSTIAPEPSTSCPPTPDCSTASFYSSSLDPGSSTECPNPTPESCSTVCTEMTTVQTTDCPTPSASESSCLCETTTPATEDGSNTESTQSFNTNPTFSSSSPFPESTPCPSTETTTECPLTCPTSPDPIFTPCPVESTTVQDCPLSCPTEEPNQSSSTCQPCPMDCSTQRPDPDPRPTSTERREEEKSSTPTEEPCTILNESECSNGGLIAGLAVAATAAVISTGIASYLVYKMLQYRKSPPILNDIEPVDYSTPSTVDPETQKGIRSSFSRTTGHLDTGNPNGSLLYETIGGGDAMKTKFDADGGVVNPNVVTPPTTTFHMTPDSTSQHGYDAKPATEKPTTSTYAKEPDAFKPHITYDDLLNHGRSWKPPSVTDSTYTYANPTSEADSISTLRSTPGMDTPAVTEPKIDYNRVTFGDVKVDVIDDVEEEEGGGGTGVEEGEKVEEEHL